MNNPHQHRKCCRSPASNHQFFHKNMMLIHGWVWFLGRVRPMSILKLWVSSDVPKYLCLTPLYITPFYHRLWVQGNSSQVVFNSFQEGQLGCTWSCRAHWYAWEFMPKVRQDFFYDFNRFKWKQVKDIEYETRRKKK